MLVTVIAACVTKAAWAEPRKLTDGDVQSYLAIRYASAVAEEKLRLARRDADKQAAIEVERQKAFTDAGWTREQFEEVRDLIEQITSALRDADDADADVATAGKQALAELDQDNVNLVRRHRAELEADDRKKAAKQVREEAAAAKRGTAPDAASLEGTWVLDLDLTVAAMSEGFGEEMRKELREKMVSTPKTTFTFGPGGTIVTTMEDASGGVREEKGTYRLEGHTLFVKAEGRRREQQMEIGIKDENLQLGKFGMFSVYRRK